MPKDFYYFDTINATKNYDSVLSVSNGIYNHPYNIYFPLKAPIRNLKRITLKSVEMPLNLYTTRIENNTTNIGLTFSYTSLSGIILSNKYINLWVSPAIYTQTSLLSTINTTLSSFVNTYNNNDLKVVSYVTSSGVINYVPGILSISLGTFQTTYNTTNCQITHNCASITIDNTPLTNYILGYSTTYKTVNSNPLQATSPINLSGFDTCLYLTFPNIPNTNNNNNVTGFKLPTNNTANNSTLFYNDSFEHQSIEFNKTNYVLDKINVVICDRLGNPLMGYFNWTFSLIIETDDSITYEYLNIEY
jgi:hypothetical protein